MNDLFVIAEGAGLQDGVNPCIFMTCAIFVVYSLRLKKASFRPGLFGILFALVYALSALVFNFGPGQFFVLHKYFILAARIIYFVLGIWAFISGVLFLKEWFLLRREPFKEEPAGKKKKFVSPDGAVVCVITIILATVLSALATMWPVDKYIIILGNAALIKGQWRTVIPLLISYALISIWPLWFVLVFSSIKNLRPSLLKIAYASVFLTAASSMILMFK